MSADAQHLDPDAIASRTFGRARKGFEPDEVRAYLVGLASETRDLLREHDDLTRRLAEVERRAADPRDLDPETVTEMLGEETAKLLVDARRTAAEIRDRAAEESEALLAEAREEAAATRQEADAYAESSRTLADEADEKIRADAEAYAARIRETAEAETAAQRTEAEQYATSVRADADAEVEAEKARVQAILDEQLATSESVLAERTAEAEAAATAIRQEADAHRDATEAEAKATLAAAERDAAEARATAEAEAADQRERAAADADRIVEEAKAEGRAMVKEAGEYRERVIADLAARRRAARSQLEKLGSIRDALAVRLTDIRHQIERSHGDLQGEVIDADEVGDLSIDRSTLLSAAPEADPAEAEDEVSDDGAETEPESEQEPEFVQAPEAEPESLPESQPEPEVEPEAPRDVDPEPAAEEPGSDDPPADAPLPDEIDESIADSADDDDDDAVEAGVAPGIDDLFARIRAERDDAPSEADAAEGLAAQVLAGEGSEDTVDVPESNDAPSEAEPADAGETDEQDSGDGLSVVESKSDDEDLLDLRDATTDELERQLARRLKRVLADEQNELLDLLRRTKGEPDPADVLPSAPDHLGRYRTAALEDLIAAERAGAGFYGDAPDRRADVEDLADAFAEDLVRQVRGRLERAFEDGATEEDVADSVRTLYREWKTQRIAEVARHHVVVAFSRGIVEAAAEGSSFRWLVDHGGAASPDCDDNALEGAVVRGSAFPTGALHPPVHPGCRCLLVPVEA